MNKWRYYETWVSPRWRINNGETNEFFLCESEKQAKWLTDILNSGGNYVWDDGIALTDDGDLVKFVKQDNNDIYHQYTGE